MGGGGGGGKRKSALGFSFSTVAQAFGIGSSVPTEGNGGGGGVGGGGSAGKEEDDIRTASNPLYRHATVEAGARRGNGLGVQQASSERLVRRGRPPTPSGRGTVGGDGARDLRTFFEQGTFEDVESVLLHGPKSNPIAGGGEGATRRPRTTRERSPGRRLPGGASPLRAADPSPELVQPTSHTPPDVWVRSSLTPSGTGVQRLFNLRTSVVASALPPGARLVDEDELVYLAAMPQEGPDTPVPDFGDDTAEEPPRRARSEADDDDGEENED
jgi:hypothetical protein